MGDRKYVGPPLTATDRLREQAASLLIRAEKAEAELARYRAAVEAAAKDYVAHHPCKSDGCVWLTKWRAALASLDDPAPSERICCKAEPHLRPCYEDDCPENEVGQMCNLLRGLARCEHHDSSIGDDAADLIERLAKVAEGAGDAYAQMLKADGTSIESIAARGSAAERLLGIALGKGLG